MLVYVNGVPNQISEKSCLRPFYIVYDIVKQSGSLNGPPLTTIANKCKKKFYFQYLKNLNSGASALWVDFTDFQFATNQPRLLKWVEYPFKTRDHLFSSYGGLYSLSLRFYTYSAWGRQGCVVGRGRRGLPEGGCWIPPPRQIRAPSPYAQSPAGQQTWRQLVGEV